MENKCYLCGMFVEKKLNKSGSISVRVMQKVHGKRKCIKVMGCSCDADEVAMLIKLRTAEYMERFMHQSYSIDAIYRFLDELCARGKTAEEIREAADESIGVKWQVEQIAFEHTKAVMGGRVTVAFYDTSTLYFESQEDDVRLPGYSKDGKSENPQVVLGLLVAAGGNPIGYEIHKGNQYEGTTLLPIVKKLEKRFCLSHPVIIADAGLLSKKNIEQLEKENYEYIIGARIRSLSKADKEAGITIYRAKFLAESLYNIEYVNPYNGKKMSVMLRTDHDEEVTKLLDAIGVKP